MANKKKMLVIEDKKAWQEAIKMTFGEDFKIISAYTKHEALEGLIDHPDVSVILMDGSLNDGSNTIELTKYIRSKYTGIIIALSGDINDELIQAGCDAGCNKGEFSSLCRPIINNFIKQGKI